MSLAKTPPLRYLSARRIEGEWVGSERAQLSTGAKGALLGFAEK